MLYVKVVLCVFLAAVCFADVPSRKYDAIEVKSTNLFESKVQEAENNQEYGSLTSNSVFRHAYSYVTSPVHYDPIMEMNYTVTLPDHRLISFIEVLDGTTDGTGGMVTITSGGLNQAEVGFLFRADAPSRGMNVNIIIYGAATNDFRYGRFSIGDDTLNTQRVYVRAIPNQRVFGSVFYNGLRTIKLVQGLAKDSSSGQLMTIGGGINANGVVLTFESDVGGYIDFYVLIYG